MPDFFSNYHQREVRHRLLYIRVHSHLLSQVSHALLTHILGKFCYWNSQYGMNCCWTLIFKVRISFQAKRPFVQDKNYLLKYPPSNHLYFKNGCLGYKMIDVSLPKNSTGKFFEPYHLEHPLEHPNWKFHLKQLISIKLIANHMACFIALVSTYHHRFRNCLRSSDDWSCLLRSFFKFNCLKSTQF